MTAVDDVSENMPLSGLSPLVVHYRSDAYITKTETAVFLSKPIKNDWQQNFWNRNNTTQNRSFRRNSSQLISWNILKH